MPDKTKKKIAIIGGGCAAMSAAWDLTTPDNDSDVECEVTIFQIGGRLGGKGASSRNTDDEKYGLRIEEHGLHLWLGYYENAFQMIRQCYTELGTRSSKMQSRLKKGSKLKKIDTELKQFLGEKDQPFDNWDWLSAFERASVAGLADESTGDWKPWIARFPEYVHRAEAEHPRSEVYTTSDGTAFPGVVVVDDVRRAYPGEPTVETEDCDGGESPCLEKLDTAFFLTHALRELKSFVDSLQTRIEHHVVSIDASVDDDPDDILSQVMSMNPMAHPDHVDHIMDDPMKALDSIRLLILAPALELFNNLARYLEGPVPELGDRIVSLLDIYIDSMRQKVEFFSERDTAIRRVWELVDLLAANIRGIVIEQMHGMDSLEELDKHNYLDWLRKNRISERTLSSPILRGAYDLAFAYKDGDPNFPQIAAGQAINGACRFFFLYKGSLFWRMKAGMGDVVFAPMYLALRERGVKFRFFHRLDDIELDSKKEKITKLRFWRQVKLKRSGKNEQTNYQPLVHDPAVGMPFFPSSPDSRQFDLTRPQRIAYKKALDGRDKNTYLNFESVWCNWQHGKRVHATIGKDTKSARTDGPKVGQFDDVIVTVPIRALERISGNLKSANNPAGERWRNMFKNVKTVATQSMQIWVNKDREQLGWHHGQVSFSAFVHPFDTWADLSQLISTENHPPQLRVQGVHYFCSVLPADYIPEYVPGAEINDKEIRTALSTIKNTHQVVKENGHRFLNQWGFHLWPKAVDRYPNIFKWNILVDGRDLESNRYNDSERLDSQHFVANIDPSEQYTQSLPGSIEYRIRPDDTGFNNLYVAGDWTESGLNFGCVEAAVMSGRLASSAITGFPNKRLIPGYVQPGSRVLEIQGVLPDGFK